MSRTVAVLATLALAACTPAATFPPPVTPVPGGDSAAAWTLETLPTDWHLGEDDPARPHPLRVVSPNAKADETEDGALVRRREQALYDRRAGEGGFTFVAFSGARWFSRTPVTLATPDRTILRYDVRATASFDDA